jgi:hypothetical protein
VAGRFAHDRSNEGAARMARRKGRPDSQVNDDEGLRVEPLIDRVSELDLLRDHLRPVCTW